MGLIYFVACLCLSASGGLTGFLFDSIGFYNLNQKISLLIYFSYSVSSFFAKQILGIFKNHKYGLMLGFGINGLQIVGTLITYVCYLNQSSTGVCNYTFLKAMNMLIGVAVGSLGCVFLWTGNYAFINFISLPEEKASHFAIYYLLLQFNGVAAHVLNFVFYSLNANTQVCFSIFLLIYVATVISIAFILPDTSNIKESSPTVESARSVELLPLS